MRLMLKLLLGLALLVGLWWAIGASGLLPRIPQEQRDALALLRAPEPALPGRNATLAAWLIARAVPRADWARFEAMAPEAAQAALIAMPAVADPSKDKFPECRAWGEDCLGRVRRDTEAARELRRELQPHFEAFDALNNEEGHLAVIGDWNFESPIPPLNGLLPPVRLDAALRFLDGDTDGAFERLCGHANWWRGLRRHNEMLIADMIGVAAISGAARTYAELLAALPADATIPASCSTAFAPLRDDELDQCRVMKTEFRGLENTLRSPLSTRDAARGESSYSRAVTRWMLRPEPSVAMSAAPFAPYCDAAQQARIAKREEMPVPTMPRCGVDGWIFNYLGCTIVPLASPTYVDYYHRVLDLDGRLRLVAAAAWLRAQAPAQDLAARFERRPESLRDPRDRFEGDDCAPRVRFEARKPRSDAPAWEIPLAPAASCATASTSTLGS
jgi:hypothetical protein